MPKFGKIKDKKLKDYVEAIEKLDGALKNRKGYEIEKVELGGLYRKIGANALHYYQQKLNSLSQDELFEKRTADAHKIGEACKKAGITNFTAEDAYFLLGQDQTLMFAKKDDVDPALYFNGDKFGILMEFFENELSADMILGDLPIVEMGVPSVDPQLEHEIEQEEDEKVKENLRNLGMEVKEEVEEVEEVKEQPKVYSIYDNILDEWKDERKAQQEQELNHPGLATPTCDEPFTLDLLSQEKYDDLVTDLSGKETLAQQRGYDAKLQKVIMAEKTAKITHEHIQHSIDNARDMHKISDFFGDALPSEQAFKEKLPYFIGMVAKGKEFFNIQRPDQYGSKLKDNFLASAQFTRQMLDRIYPDFTNEIPSMEEFYNTAKEKFANKSLDSITYELQAKEAHEIEVNKLASMFEGKSEKDQKKAFDKIIENVLKNKQPPYLPELNARYEATFGSIGNIAEYVVNTLGEKGITISADIVRSSCESHLDGVKTSREMWQQFTRFDLNMLHKAELSEKEYNFAHLEVFPGVKYAPNIEKLRQTGLAKLKGITVCDKSSELLKDALATYATMRSMKESRGFFFKVFHPNRWSSEKEVVKSMGDLLTQQFGFTEQELTNITRDERANSLDAINMLCKKMVAPMSYEADLEQAQNRAHDRKIIAKEETGDLIYDPRLKNPPEQQNVPKRENIEVQVDKAHENTQNQVEIENEGPDLVDVLDNDGPEVHQ